MEWIIFRHVYISDRTNGGDSFHGYELGESIFKELGRRGRKRQGKVKNRNINIDVIQVEEIEIQIAASADTVCIYQFWY